MAWCVRFMEQPWLPSTTPGMRAPGSATGSGTHRLRPVQGGAPRAAVGGWRQRVLSLTGSPTAGPRHALLNTAPRSTACCNLLAYLSPIFTMHVFWGVQGQSVLVVSFSSLRSQDNMTGLESERPRLEFWFCHHQLGELEPISSGPVCPGIKWG